MSVLPIVGQVHIAQDAASSCDAYSSGRALPSCREICDLRELLKCKFSMKVVAHVRWLRFFMQCRARNAANKIQPRERCREAKQREKTEIKNESPIHTCTICEKQQSWQESVTTWWWTHIEFFFNTLPFLSFQLFFFYLLTSFSCLLLCYILHTQQQRFAGREMFHKTKSSLFLRT